MRLNEEPNFDPLKNQTDDLTIKRSLEAREASWYEFMTLGNFDVPDYQRNYSWESNDTGNGKQRDEFWRTLEDEFEELEDVPPYLIEPDESSPDRRAAGVYMGAVYISQSEEGEYNVVDGQQRLVSFQLLIGALLENIDGIHDRLGSEDEEDGSYELLDSLEKCKEDLGEAYDSSLASLSLNKEDEEFFKMLSAQPTQTSLRREVVHYLEGRIEQDDSIDGQNKPRAIKADQLVHYLNGDTEQSHSDIRNSTTNDGELHGLHSNKIPIDEITTKVQNELDSDSEGEDEESDVLDTYIKFYESHAKLLNCYLEAYGLVERLKDKYSDGQLEKEANTLVNFTYFILYGGGAELFS